MGFKVEFSGLIQNLLRLTNHICGKLGIRVKLSFHILPVKLYIKLNYYKLLTKPRIKNRKTYKLEVLRTAVNIFVNMDSMSTIARALEFVKDQGFVSMQFKTELSIILSET